MSPISESGLNPAQQAAVAYTDGPMLILAGAGSGKTRVLTHKVAYLIEEKGYRPEEILMVTFTNKAAKEMTERIKRLLGSATPPIQGLPVSGTFHSLAARMLRRHGNAIGISADFVIYDPSDQKEAIKQVMMRLDISQKQYHPNAILHTISGAKNELITPSQYQDMAYGQFQKVVGLVYKGYQDLLSRNHALDFDDLLMKAVALLEQERVRSQYIKQFRYVLIDEYQDTNQAQFELTKLLTGNEHMVCVVGDASQSIYAWRGANIGNMVSFQRTYPDTKVFHLEQNYRSTQTILDSAFSVISKNSSHPILKLWTENPAGNLVNLFEAHNEQEEARFIIDQIQKEKLSFNDVVVLYRTNAQSRALEEVFLHEGVPYSLVGGVRFYERAEVKDVLAYLRVLLNPNDSVSEKRILKIGKRRAERFYEFQKELKNKENIPTLELLDQVLAKTSYLDLYDDAIEEDRMRLENIKEMRSVASNFPVLAEFLENVALVENEYFPNGTRVSEETENRVTLMTLHAAKGLEFPAVFMVGMEEGLFPHSRALMDTSELEEERRLCYVGITRGKKYLYLTHARSRLYFGSHTNNVPSRFISDIPEELLQKSAYTSSYYF